MDKLLSLIPYLKSTVIGNINVEGDFFSRIFTENIDALISLPTEVKIGVVVLALGLLVFGLLKKIFKLVLTVVVLFVLYIILVNMGVL